MRPSAGCDREMEIFVEKDLRRVRLWLILTVIASIAVLPVSLSGQESINSSLFSGMQWRLIGPFRHDGMGPLFLQANRNKRSVVLDLKSQDGRDALLALAASVDQQKRVVAFVFILD